MIVIAIDPGRNSAIAAGEADPKTGQIKLLALIPIRLPRKVPARLPHLIGVFEDLHSKILTAEKATIEHPFPRKGPDGKILNRTAYDTQVSDMTFFQAACQSVFRIWPEEIYPSAWQSKVKIGRGKENSLKTCRFYGIELENHNEADAVMMLIYTAFRFGIDPALVPIKRRPNESEQTYQIRLRMHTRLTQERGISPAILRFMED